MKFVSFIILYFIPPTGAIAQQWTIQNNTEASLNAVHFVDSYIGWAVGDNGIIIHTNDGGETWVEQESRTTDDLFTVWFFDEFTGWIGGEENTLLFTENGGSRWIDRRPSSVTGQDILTVHFFDWRRGWSAGGPDGNIYYSDDAGTTWARKGSLGESINVKQIHIQGITGRNVLVATNHSLFQSNDRGETWHETENELRADFIIKQFFFLNDNLGWLLGFSDRESLIYKTEDGGESWGLIQNLPDQSLVKFHFSDTKAGMAISEIGQVFTTQNGGQDWTQSDQQINQQVNEAWFEPNNTIWVVGEDGFIARYDGSPELSASELYELRYPSFRLSNEDEAIELLNRALSYGESASQTENIYQRKPKYIRLNKALSNVQQFYQTQSPPERIQQRMIELPHVFWANEYNAGAEHFNQAMESQNSEILIETALAHFQNAVTILPDSAVSHVSLAMALEITGNLKGAATAMEYAINRIQSPEKEHFEYLIQLYMEMEEFDLAKQTTLTAAERFQREPIFSEYLVDLYSQTGDIESSIDYLNRLVDQNPLNTEYRYTRGSQTYNIAYDLLNQALLNYEQAWILNEDLIGNENAEDRRDIESEINELSVEFSKLKQRSDDLMSQSINDFGVIIQEKPDNDYAYSYLGMMYYSRATVLEKMLFITPDDETAERFGEELGENLQMALENYKQAIEINPDNQEYSRVLIQIYIQLGMEAEASKLNSKF